MKKTLIQIIFYIISFCLSAQATNYYISPNGTDSNNGTYSNPFQTLETAINLIQPGDSIFLLSGTYSMTGTVLIDENKNGTDEANIALFAYSEQDAILNFSVQEESSSNRGLILNADYWHIKGVIIEEAGDNGLLISGNNNTIENCIFRENHDTGLQLSRYNTSYNSVDLWPSDNLITGCEAYDNKDSDNEDADGFAAKLTCGNGNVFRNCVSHHNIDDGWDLYTKSSTGAIGVVTLENCIAHGNGSLTDGVTSGNGDKNGFKLGGENISVDHIVRRCIAFNNGKHGFTYNRNLGTIEVTNCTGYNNEERNFNFDGGTSVFNNNLSFQTSSNDRIIGTDNSSNIWDNDDATTLATEDDFVSLTPGQNNAPTTAGFLNLDSESLFIDAGNVMPGISYNGTAPDIGAVESGDTTNYTLYTLTVECSGSGSVSPGNGKYVAGTEISLLATPTSDNWMFDSWSGDISSTSNPLSFSIDSDISLTANFLQTNSGTVDDPGNTLCIEAESASDQNNFSPFTVEDNDDACGGQCIVSPSTSYTSGVASDGNLEYEFEITEAGVYYAWFRLICPSGEEDSYWIKMDDGDYIRFNEITKSTDWIWEQVYDVDNNDAYMTCDLTEGTHTLTVVYREMNARLDKILITDNADIQPVDCETCEEASASAIYLSSAPGAGLIDLSWLVRNFTLETQAVYRNTEPDISGATKIAEIETSEREYSDMEIEVGTTYYYWITGTDDSGNAIESNVSIATTTESGSGSTTILLCKEYRDNFDVNIFPNPCKDALTVKFQTENTTQVSIKLYDITGRERLILINQSYSSGSWQETYSLPDELQNGMYFIRIETIKGNAVKALIKN